MCSRIGFDGDGFHDACGEPLAPRDCGVLVGPVSFNDPASFIQISRMVGVALDIHDCLLRLSFLLPFYHATKQSSLRKD